MKAVIWSKPSCVYCDKAKQLMKVKGIDYEDDYETGPEYQLLDNELAPSESLPHRQVASLYDMYAPNSSPYLPAGQWNVAEIRVLDNEVEHWLNDELVLQYNFRSNPVCSSNSGILLR